MHSIQVELNYSNTPISKKIWKLIYALLWAHRREKHASWSYSVKETTDEDLLHKSKDYVLGLFNLQIHVEDVNLVNLYFNWKVELKLLVMF
jgi:hypothetical protein